MENQRDPSGKFPGHGRLSSLTNNIKSTVKAMFSSFAKNGLLYFVAGLFPALIIGWLVFPALLYSKQVQPMKFNHALHMEPEIVSEIKGDTETDRCLYCHAFRNDGSFTGIPGIDICSECHNAHDFPLGESEGEELLIKRYVTKEKDIPWLSYSRQPDCVYFSHIAHIELGKLECMTCHGDKRKNQVLPAYEKNRISGYSRNIWGKNVSGSKKNTWDSMKMDDCA
ncbi:MAG: menaquinone reductase multiheme cytochrome c subunit QrcA, partial [Methanosarcina sp.]|nr:menaquinone reductase multiheme cytochrome c subunit QrcA [Methanosarcina sp.]